MKKVELRHAEVIKQYNSQDVYKVNEIEGKGTIVNFSVKVKVNDRIERSPIIFEKCKYYSESSENIETIKKSLVAGNIVNIKGFQDKYTYKDRQTGEKRYLDQVSVSEIEVINGNKNQSTNDISEDDLPF